ncbi:MAG: winged helix-turn-helix domain-containing protein [Terracidiphilus sp.]
MSEVEGIIRFDRYEVDLRAGELRRNNRPVKLQNQVFRLLLTLLRNRGQVWTRGQLKTQIWPPDVFIDSENGLNTAVRKLRVVLGKPPGSRTKSSYIETVPRVGYRFTPVENGRSIAERLNSVAILPFTNDSGNNDLEFLCEGLTEALIDAASQIRGVQRVIARNSVYRFKGRDPQEAGRELGVEAVVSGNVQTTSDRVLVRAELLSTTDGARIWSTRYETPLQDMPLLPSKLASALQVRFGSRVDARTRHGVAHRATTNPEAYRLYLRGRYFWAKRPTAGCVDKAIEMFSAAVALDPAFALAHVGLADCYNTLGAWEGGVLEPAVALEKGKAAAHRALHLQPNLAEAHTSLGYCHLSYDWDWRGAEVEFKRAILLNPNYSHAHHWYSHLLVAMGRMDEALQHSLRIIELDPLDMLINSHLAWHYHMTGDYQAEVEECRKLLEMEPQFHKAHYFMGLALEQLGCAREATTFLQKSYEISGSTVMLAALGHAHAAAGDRDKAVGVLRTLQELSKTRYVSAYELGTIHVGLQEHEQALQCLEEAYMERSGWMPYLANDPTLAPLRREARFQRLLRCVSNKGNEH